MKTNATEPRKKSDNSQGGFHLKGGRLHADGVDLSAVAARYGTPVYVYSARRIRENYRAYHKAFTRVLGPGRFGIFYACKANGNQAVLSLLQKEGAGADIVSRGEMRRALAAGIAPARIVFSGVGKTAEDIAAALASGVTQINIESAEELELIAAVARKSRRRPQIALRLNPDVAARTHAFIATGRKGHKFGIDMADAARLFRQARAMPEICLDGLAVHIGSQITSLAPYKKAYARLAETVRLLKDREGTALRRLDLGGGIGIAYQDGDTTIDLHLYALMIRDIFGAFDLGIQLEPGRSLVGDAGVLLARVAGVKKSRPRPFIILDAAMNDLLRPALYGARHRLAPLAPRPGRKTACDVVGPVCETGDTFLTDVRLPPLMPGDFVALRDAGAYGMAMASTYNARPLAGEVLVDGRRHARIRRQQDIGDLIAEDKVPAWI